jgi:hypothetical protein
MDIAFLKEVLLAKEGDVVIGFSITQRVCLKPISNTLPPIRATPQATKKTKRYPQVSTMKPLGRAPRVLDADSNTTIIAMEAAFFDGDAAAPIYPRLGPKRAERVNPQNKKTINSDGIF